MICARCNEPILWGALYTRFAGQWYHRSCEELIAKERRAKNGKTWEGVMDLLAEKSEPK